MYFNNEPQASTHAVSKPIDILRSQSNESNIRYGYQASNEKPARPVNRVKPSVIINTPTALVSLKIGNYELTQLFAELNLKQQFHFIKSPTTSTQSNTKTFQR